MKRRASWSALCLPLLSAIGALVTAEGSLFIAERWLGMAKFELWRKLTAEARHAASPPSSATSFAHFDPILGWRNFHTKTLPPGVRETLGPELWRHPTALPRYKNGTRVAILGDSFVFGWDVDDSETFPALLERRLGSGAEVWNLGVRGHGVDQMSLVATEILPAHSPDIVVMAFIRATLDRACQRFAFGARKPFFALENDSLSLEQVPLPRPDEIPALWPAPLATFLSIASRSRVIALAAQPWLLRDYRACLAEKVPRLFRRVRETYPSARVIAAHLDGPLPPRLARRLREYGLEWISVPKTLPTLSARLGIAPERHPDGHPKAPLNRLYAEALALSLSRSPARLAHNE